MQSYKNCVLPQTWYMFTFWHALFETKLWGLVKTEFYGFGRLERWPVCGFSLWRKLKPIETPGRFLAEINYCGFESYLKVMIKKTCWQEIWSTISLPRAGSNVLFWGQWLKFPLSIKCNWLLPLEKQLYIKIYHKSWSII